MANSRTPKKPSVRARVISRVAKAISLGHILKAWNALDNEDTTVGPYHEAVDRGFKFTVVGWKSHRPQRNFHSPIEAAELFVDRVGTTRANDAAVQVVGRI